MVDVIIKGVPEGAEEAVKNMAAVAVERFLSEPLQPPEADVKKLKEDVDAFRSANGLEPKFSAKEIE